MDFKSSKRSTRLSRRRRNMPTRRSRAFRNPSIPLPLANTNRMSFTTSWTVGLISSSTAGNLISSAAGAVLSPTIQNASEYGSVNTLFREIKLKRFQLIFTSTQMTPGSSNVNHSTMVIGTNITANANNIPSISNFNNVQNSANRKYINTYRTEPFIYEAYVPPDLEFSNIDNDAPSTATPYAGSPGIVTFYCTGLNASAGYFYVTATAHYILRGRY